MTAKNTKIHGLYRYPIKGLSPEPLANVRLEAGAYFPGDRLYAIENGPSGFDAAMPAYEPKIKFLMLMRNERLVQLTTRFDDATSTLTIREGDRDAIKCDLSTEDGRLAIEAFFRRFMPKELRGPPKVLTAPAGFRFTDSRRGFVSIINLSSIVDLETAVGAPVHPLRFRANIYVAGWPPWREFELIGREIVIGSARLKVTKRIQRCAATDVDPDTGIRDLSIPRTLLDIFGHTDFGIYAEVVGSGQVAIGDSVAERATEQQTLPF